MVMRIVLLSMVLALSVCLPGCGQSGPELLDVHGTVTMDDKPLPGAYLTFRRSDFAGRPSYGSTDENGQYRLGYSHARDGALRGAFTVEISTFSDPYTDENGVPHPRMPETVPARYNRNTELTATIEEDGQEINFDLTSDGEVIQP